MGKAKGTISVSFTEESILSIVSNMFGEEMKAMNEEIKDAVGELRDAQHCVEEALGLSQEYNEKELEGLSKMWLGRTLGKLETASSKCEEYILQGIQTVNELKIKPFSAQGYLFWGELHADTGQREKALANLKKAEEMFQEMGMDYWLAQTQEVLGRL